MSREKSPKRIIHVACNIDKNYVKYCTVMLVSMFENSPGEHFHVHIIADGVPQDSLEILTRTVRSYGSEITLYEEVKHLLKDCLPPEGNTHVTLTSYYRCFLDSILPDTIEKVFYLDSDMIVCGNIRELWETDITGYPVGAVEDMDSGVMSKYERLGIPPENTHFNAGVLLVNLKEWRNLNLSPKSIKLIIEGHEIHHNHDQDVLNRLFHATWKRLPLRWNVQDGFIRKNRRIRPEAIATLEEELKTPAIIHYTRSKKPWHYLSFHPYTSLYFKYLDKTPWKGERPIPTWRDRYKRLTYQFSSLLGLNNNYRRIN